MGTLSNIENPVWGIGTLGYGVIVEGIASIRQCIDIILRTRKGSDPLRPLFGSDVSKHIDEPVLYSIPRIKKAIIEAIELWEPRVRITEITHYLKTPSNPVFEITYTIIDQDLLDKISFDIKNGNIEADDNNEALLQAFFPPNPKGYRYQVSFIKNGVKALPLPNLSGFATIAELYQWIQAKWFFYGRWFLLSDRLVCYIKTEGLTSATLLISVLPIVRIEALMPDLLPNESYLVAFKVGGIDAMPSMPNTFVSPGQVLSWAQSNWGNYGSWYIEAATLDGTTIFSDEFSNEFGDGGPTYSFKLVCISNTEGFTATLDVSAIEN